MAPLNFDDRVAIVTGGGRGLGREYALLLARRGARVVVNDAGVEVSGRNPDPGPAAAVVKEIAGAGGTATANVGDVRQPTTGTLLVEQALDEYGRLDIVVNNAGVIFGAPFPEQSDDALADTIGVHLCGTVRLTRAAWPHLAKAGYGRIVNTTSASVFGLPGLSLYAAVKGGVYSLTRTLALEGASLGIRANCIAPSGWTRMAIQFAGDVLLTPEVWEYAEKSMPPAVNAGVVAFLAHERCTLTGEVLSYSGRRLSRWVLSETEGIRVGGTLTPEEVADQLGTISSTTTLHHFERSDALGEYTRSLGGSA